MATHKKTKSAKGLLRTIGQFFRDPKVSTDEMRAAWSVLTALRGPDSGVDAVNSNAVIIDRILAKHATTAVIRERVVGKHAAHAIGADVFEDSANKRDQRSVISQASHFGNHARRAFEALGMEWDEVNPSKEKE